MKVNRTRTARCLLLSLVVLGTAVVLPGRRSDPEVTLRPGTVKGTVMSSTHGKSSYAFRGMPYGRVVQRFERAEPADPWSGILDATQDGPACKQYDIFGSYRVSGEEDCLVLNVYTSKLPVDGMAALLPVLVFIHGGGCTVGEGSSRLFGPEFYMNHEMVLVTLNYRLGPFGFLSTGDEALPGNYGLLDQSMALRWINDYIENFGGDPDRVTLSGQSVGALFVVLHMLSPLSNDLFHGAIIESGSPVCLWAIQENPLNISQRIAQKANCPVTNTAEMVQCLREVDADTLSRAVDLAPMRNTWTFAMAPVVENETYGQFLTRVPFKLLSEGRFHKIPVVIGITTNETASLVSGLLNGGDVLEPQDFRDEDWWTHIRALVNIGPGSSIFDNPETIDTIKRMYFENVDLKDRDEFLSMSTRLGSDIFMNACINMTAQLLIAGGVPVYAYVWGKTSKEVSNVNLFGKPAVSHSAELFYLFNRTKQGLANYTTEDVQEFSDQAVTLWTNFVTYGNPTPKGTPIQWSTMNVGHNEYLSLDTIMTMKSDSWTEHETFWNEIIHNGTKNLS